MAHKTKEDRQKEAAVRRRKDLPTLESFFKEALLQALKKDGTKEYQYEAIRRSRQNLSSKMEDCDYAEPAIERRIAVLIREVLIETNKTPRDFAHIDYQHVIGYYLEVPLLDSQKKELNLHALLPT